METEDIVFEFEKVLKLDCFIIVKDVVDNNDDVVVDNDVKIVFVCGENVDDNVEVVANKLEHLLTSLQSHAVGQSVKQFLSAPKSEYNLLFF